MQATAIPLPPEADGSPMPAARRVVQPEFGLPVIIAIAHRAATAGR